MPKSEYWEAVNRRVNHLVRHKGWPRSVALANTRALFKASPQWRARYSGRIRR